MRNSSFADHVVRETGGALRRGPVTAMQINVGLRCDLACHHCHVEAGPNRREAIDRKTADRVLELLERNPGVATLDLTGGAPELNDHFRHLVRGARSLGRGVIDRCNLTVFDQPGQEDTPEFLANQGVRVIASLPCYTTENVERQRGRGVFARSIAALERLNALGYGRGDVSRALELVYNPQGASLPPHQGELETRYREELREHFGITFDRLLTITNMPIRRFAHALERDGQMEAYLSLLVNHFNPDTLPELMCRRLLSVSHDGSVHDCDFNQALALPLGGRATTIFDLGDFDELIGTPIATGPHCFGCTAGRGSSCAGALA
ncbi:MAG: arsenosugar biosynthesis radical SAM (seleno)protein ArsS [Myxococcota bacterium]